MKPSTAVHCIGAATALALMQCTAPCHVEVQLHPLFTNNMVLQRERPLPVWRTAAPHEKVTVRVGGKAGSTRAEGRPVARDMDKRYAALRPAKRMADGFLQRRALMAERFLFPMLWFRSQWRHITCG